MVYLLTDELWFPKASEATEEGLLAVGGDLSVNRLKLAYNSGIFPWYSEGRPIMWWSPDPRMILIPGEFRSSKSLRKLIEKEKYSITENQAFEKVIRECAEIPRPGQDGTWITEEMIEAYTNLFSEGIARSVEIWDKDKLVGGLYGVDLPKKRVFCGESMFSKVSNASKIALNYLVEKLRSDYKLIDCQVYTEHLARLGAREVPRHRFLELLHSD